MEYITLVFGALVALYLYKKRLFLDHVTYSGNLIKTNAEGGTELLIRTIQVLPIGDLLPSNPLFKLQLWWAIQKCCIEDVFIRMNERSMDVLQPAIINGLAATAGKEILDHIGGGEIRYREVLIAITFEKYGGIKSHKLRVMVVSQDTLKSITDEGIDINKIGFERSHHVDRIETLIQMAKLWEEEKKLNPHEPRIIRQVRIPV